jgi:hypothetical protein
MATRSLVVSFPDEASFRDWAESQEYLEIATDLCFFLLLLAHQRILSLKIDKDQLYRVVPLTLSI